MPESRLSLPDLGSLSDSALVRLRANLELEMVRRGKGFSVGEIGEALVIDFFKSTAGFPMPLKAPVGTKNVDCLSRVRGSLFYQDAMSSKEDRHHLSRSA